jgi:hypothetical protein
MNNLLIALFYLLGNAVISIAAEATSTLPLESLIAERILSNKIDFVPLLDL